MFGTKFGTTGWRLDPWREFGQIESLLDNVFSESRRGYPPVNVLINGDEAVVKAEVPGVDPKDIEISVEGRALTLKGKRRAAEPGEDASYYRRERWHGDFERMIEVPFNIEAKKVTASSKDGILSIRLPKAEADKPKKIEVTLN